MIQEAYCSYEVAKLLNEKGFVQETLMVYNQNGNFMPNGAIEDTYQVFYSAPTHQMAMAWLREIYDIYIVFFHTNKSGWWYNITDMKDSYVFYSSEKTMCSYEEAMEAALKYTLENLI